LPQRHSGAIVVNMKRRLLLLIPVVVGLAMFAACGKLTNKLTDPAVRLANCIEEGVKKSLDGATSIDVNCDLQLAGNYVVVLHPAGEKTDDELVTGGVPAETIPAVRALRNGDHAAIYVVASDKQTPDSRTTYQNNFVSFDHVMVAAKSTQPVMVSIGGPAGARVIQAIK
jgi:hypothetical protein